MSGSQRRSAIVGTGSELPAKVITNRDLEKMVDTSDEWITVRTGIRERRVLELRYGLNGQHPCTLDEVGRAFNVTRERIRQIENQSLKKLRALAESQKLRDVA